MEVVVRISPGSVLIDGVLYKSVKTRDGNYTADVRRQYMRAWRTKRRLLRIIK